MVVYTCLTIFFFKHFFKSKFLTTCKITQNYINKFLQVFCKTTSTLNKFGPKFEPWSFSFKCYFNKKLILEYNPNMLERVSKPNPSQKMVDSTSCTPHALFVKKITFFTHFFFLFCGHACAQCHTWVAPVSHPDQPINVYFPNDIDHALSTT